MAKKETCRSLSRVQKMVGGIMNFRQTDSNIWSRYEEPKKILPFATVTARRPALLLRGISPAVPGRLVTNRPSSGEMRRVVTARLLVPTEPRFHFSEEQESATRNDVSLSFPGRAAADCETEIKHCWAVLSRAENLRKSSTDGWKGSVGGEVLNRLQPSLYHIVD